MQVKDVIRGTAEVVTPDTSLREAAHKMSVRHTAMLPVCEGQRIVGVLTARDLTVRATAEGRDPQTTRVGDVMMSPAVYCWENQGVHEAAELMYKWRISRLPVLDRRMHVIGIVSLRDLGTEVIRRPKLRRSTK